MKTGTVKVRYTIGAGNNIFQYMYARLLAETHGLNLATPRLPVLDIDAQEFPYGALLPLIEIGKGEKDFHQYLEPSREANFVVHTYPEDYTVYKPHLNMIRSWVPDVPKTNTDDLVLHLRLGDRLLCKNDHLPCMRVEAVEYCQAMSNFDFERLHIVTDMPVWERIVANQLEQLRFHIDVPREHRVPTQVSVDYFNSLVDCFADFDPIVRCRNSIRDDFNYMRSFDKILFQHGTLAWWAATLSHASKVGVFGPWRPSKGLSNKNLGKTDFDGWFSWGNSINC